jgi:hypothetical protein
LEFVVEAERQNTVRWDSGIPMMEAVVDARWMGKEMWSRRHGAVESQAQGAFRQSAKEGIAVMKQSPGGKCVRALACSSSCMIA